MTPALALDVALRGQPGQDGVRVVGKPSVSGPVRMMNR